MNKIVTIETDPDTACPMDHDSQWTLVSFNQHSIHYTDPDTYLKPGIDRGAVLRTKKLVRQAEAGLLFQLQYYEHGAGRYDIKGEGPQCQWDTAPYAGVLVWRHPAGDLGPKTFEARAADARVFLETYNAWMNGECYDYCITDAAGTDIDSCGGYYDDYVNDAIAECLSAGDVIAVKGEAAFVFNEKKMPPGVTVVKSTDEFLSPPQPNTPLLPVWRTNP